MLFDLFIWAPRYWPITCNIFWVSWLPPSTLPHAQLKMHSLQAWCLSQFNPLQENPAKCLQVTPELSCQLMWWTFKPDLLIGQPFRSLQLSFQITTDASTTGWGAHCSIHKVQIREAAAYQSSGNPSSNQGPSCFLSSGGRLRSTSGYRQHDHSVLHKQAGRHSLIVSPIFSNPHMGVVL